MHTFHIHYACSLDDDDAYAFLLQENMFQEAVDYAIDSENFEKALSLAEEHEPEMVDEVKLAIAQNAEDTEDLTTAEELYIELDRKQDAYDMYRALDKAEDMKRLLEAFPKDISN